MADTINKIFSNGSISTSKNVQKVRYNREYLLSEKVGNELNTYRTFGVFPTFSDSVKPEYKQNDNGDWEEVDNGTGTPGVRSLFNRAGAVLLGSSDGEYNVDVTKGDVKNTHEWRIINNVPLMDSPKARQRIRAHSGCSVKELVEASAAGMMGRGTYSYSDFMYCKHLGKVSNN
jgi:hypothetical protein